MASVFHHLLAKKYHPYSCRQCKIGKNLQNKWTKNITSGRWPLCSTTTSQKITAKFWWRFLKLNCMKHHCLQVDGFRVPPSPRRPLCCRSRLSFFACCCFTGNIIIDIIRIINTINIIINFIINGFKIRYDSAFCLWWPLHFGRAVVICLLWQFQITQIWSTLKS